MCFPVFGYAWGEREIAAVREPPAICRPLRRLSALNLDGRIADSSRMTTSPSLRQFAWLFTRGEESVRLEAYPNGKAFRLVINGPGIAQATHEFDMMSSLMIFVTQHQERLLNDDFKLQASAERRADRRPTEAEGSDRRR